MLGEKLVIFTLQTKTRRQRGNASLEATLFGRFNTNKRNFFPSSNNSLLRAAVGAKPEMGSKETLTNS